MNPTDPTPLPCPFCGSEVACIDVHGEDETGERYGYWAIECHKCHNQQYATVLSGVHGDEKADAIRAWNTRAPSAELAQAQAEAAAMREWVEATTVDQITLANGKILRKGDMLSCAGGKTILNQLGAWRLEVQKLRDINKRACEDWADDDTAIKAECKAFGIDVDGDSYGVPTMVDCVRQLAALAAQMSAEREHNAMEALAMRAERDEARKERDEAVQHIQLAGGYHERTPREIEIAEVLSDSPPELWESADHVLNDLLDIIDAGRNRVFTVEAERDAANALVAAIKREADKLHEDCIRDGETDAYCLTSEQIAALAKHFLPTTTENTKPQ